MDLDAIVIEKTAEVNKSKVGKFLNSLAKKIGGISRLAGINALCAAVVGVVVSYPVYVVGGFWAALAPAALTLAVVLSILIPISCHNLRFTSGKRTARTMLLFAIIFSLFKTTEDTDKKTVATSNNCLTKSRKTILVSFL